MATFNANIPAKSICKVVAHFPPISGIEKAEADSVQEAGMEIENILAGSSKKGGNSLVFRHEGEGWTVMQSPMGTMV